MTEILKNNFEKCKEKVKDAFKKLPGNGFVISRDGSEIANFLNLSQKDVFSVLNDFQATLYPDAITFIQDLIHFGSLPVIWTQGEVGEKDLEAYQLEAYQNDTINVPFQILKIIRSGVKELLAPYSSECTQLGLRQVYGGHDKKNPDLLDEMLRNKHIKDRTIVFVDDMLENLRGILPPEGVSLKKEYPSSIPKIELYHICRDPKVHINYGQTTDGIKTIRNLSEIPNLFDRVFFLDFDRTLMDTDYMKLLWVEELARLLQQKR